MSNIINFSKKGDFMPGIKLKEGESFESAVRRFKKQCEKAGILAEVRKRECFEKPSIQKKKKQNTRQRCKLKAKSTLDI